jgi:hypothetical protein
MHPYIAYLILSDPANSHASRPDERCFGLRTCVCQLWRRWQPGQRAQR